MDFEPDDNQFGNNSRLEDDDAAGPNEFRPRPADSSIDIMTLPAWQNDTSTMPSTPAQPASTVEVIPTEQLDPLTRAMLAQSQPALSASHKPDEDHDNDANSDEESEEEKRPAAVETPKEPVVKFPIDLEINSKIALWLGDVTKLKCDAIVNPTNETMTSRTGLAGKIVEAAGPDLIAELPTVDNCKTGECRITKGFNLPANWILHTVGPRYNDKYITAAENALHNCYRSCLETAIENRLKTVALTVVHSTRRGYPADLGAHIAIRTLRRFMERWGRATKDKSVRRVVLAFESQESYDVYRRILPQYCPRNDEELQYALKNLPADTGNEHGETVVQERTVRISAFPALMSPSASTNNSITTGNGITSASEGTRSNEFDRSALSGLTAMQGDRDSERRRKLASLSPEQIQQQQLYMNYLQLAHRTDLREVEQLNILYQSGTDSAGRPIMVFCAMRLPEDNQALLDKIFLYYIKTMDIVANHDYILIYAHTHMASKSKPDFSWLRKVYNVFDEKYGDHMVHLFVLHPTFWLKVVDGFFSTFASSRVFSKIRYIERVVDLYDTVGRDQIKLPPEIMKYDQEVNGSIDTLKKAAKQSADRL